MQKLFDTILSILKASAAYTTLFVFIGSGLYLLIIDGADLNNRKLGRELKIARIFGFIYIFGSVIAYIVIKHVL
jgi:hypothetical protein